MKFTIPFQYTGEIGAVTIQWYLGETLLTDGDHDGVTVSGATTDTLVVDNVTVGWTGPYHAVVTDSAGCTSTTEDVSFNCELAITSHTPSTAITPGFEDAITLSVTVEGYVGPTLEAQWYKDGVALTDGIFPGFNPGGESGYFGTYSIGGSNTLELTIINLQPINGGAYTIVVTDPVTGCQVELDSPIVLALVRLSSQSPYITGNGASLWNGTVGYEYVTRYHYSASPGQPWAYETFGVPLTQYGLTGTITWSISSGSLPPGLSLEVTTGSTCNFEGTPTTPGTYNFTVRATDTDGNYGERVCAMAVLPPYQLEEFPALLAQWATYSGGSFSSGNNVFLAAESLETGVSLIEVAPGILATNTPLATLISLPVGTPGTLVFALSETGSSYTVVNEQTGGLAQLWTKGDLLDREGSYPLTSEGGSVPPGSPNPVTVTLI